MAIRNDNLSGTDFQDTGVTALDGAIDDSVTTIPVDSTATFKAEGFIRIGSEIIRYTDKSATEFQNCTRGFGNTVADSHSDNADVFEREVLLSGDLNDTFDALANKVNTLTTFWLNDDLYDVYDDFESYSVGAFTTNAKWVVTTNTVSGGSASATINSSTNAGGTGKELALNMTGSNNISNNQTVTIAFADFPLNQHVFMRLWSSYSKSTSGGTVTFRFKINSTNYTINTYTANGTTATPLSLLLIAKGSGVYDVYSTCSKLIASDVDLTSATVAIELYAFESTTNAKNVYVDDVRVSKGTVN